MEREENVVLCLRMLQKSKRETRQTRKQCLLCGRNIFAYYGATSARARWFFQTYRKRFGIETSYRQANECRIRTTTRKPQLRLLYFALAMIMRNCWIGFERTYVMDNGRKSRQDRATYFSFKDLLSCLRKILEKELESATFEKRGNPGNLLI